MREIWMSIINTTYNSIDDIVNKLQELKGKTKLKFYKKISNYYNEMKNKNFQTQQDHFAKNAKGISKIYHEVLLLIKFLQTKPDIKNMSINCFDLYFTVNKIRDENEDIDKQYENDENDYIEINDFISPNHNIAVKPRDTILR